MSPERERAYWYLLYYLLIGLRLQSGGGILACLDLFHWRKSQRMFDLVDAFHNLPLFGSKGWERFDEQLFWKSINHYHSQHPEDKRNFKEIFERQLADENAR